jgi:hypothetical protein
MIVKFTADQVAKLGLPHRACQVEYNDKGQLENYSAWLGKSSWHEPGIDKLIELADKVVYH